MRMLLVALAGLCAVALASPLSSRLSGSDMAAAAPEWVMPMGKYAHYDQCDSKWGEHYMGNKTICAVGCFMSSTSSAVHDHGIKFQVSAFGEMPVTSNPGTLNAWLHENGGYDNNLFKNDEVYKLCHHFPDRRCVAEFAVLHDHERTALSPAQLRALLDNYVTVLANVNDGGHFVRLVGYHAALPETVFAMDPGFHRVVYSMKHDIVGYRVFAFDSLYTPDPATRPGGPDMKAAAEAVLGANFKEWARPDESGAGGSGERESSDFDIAAAALGL